MLQQQGTTQSLVLSTKVGVMKETMLYLSPEALHAASSGCSYERAVSDDLWSACLVILEMDAGLTIQNIMTAHGGSVRIDELLTKTSPQLLPLLCSVLIVPSGDLATHPHSNCKTAAGQPMRDAMHLRLKARAREWGKQHVLFDTASSYPCFCCR